MNYNSISQTSKRSSYRNGKNLNIFNIIKINPPRKLKLSCSKAKILPRGVLL